MHDIQTAWLKELTKNPSLVDASWPASVLVKSDNTTIALHFPDSRKKKHLMASEMEDFPNPVGECHEG